MKPAVRIFLFPEKLQTGIFMKADISQLNRGLFDQLQAVADQGMVEMEYEDTFSVVTQALVLSSEGNPGDR